MIRVDRPEASKEKIKTSDSFELCYLRHRYFRRAKYNPTEKEMAPYMYIVENLSKATFFTYFNLFKSVGMYHDDVKNIGRVHLVSFLGLYTLEEKPAKKEEFVDNFLRYKYKDPKKEDFLQKNRANFTMFFKQRMEDLVRICRQKVRNVKGQVSEEYTIFCGKEPPPKYPRKLLRESQELGYRKIDFSIFRSVRKKADVNGDATIFKYDGLWYVAIPLDQRALELEDLVGSQINPYDNFHNKRPDELYLEEEEKNLHTMFNNTDVLEKKTVLENFIANNRKNRQYKEEIAAARRLLRSLGE